MFSGVCFVMAGMASCVAGNVTGDASWFSIATIQFVAATMCFVCDD
jgi:hypothetical protein